MVTMMEGSKARCIYVVSNVCVHSVRGDVRFTMLPQLGYGEKGLSEQGTNHFFLAR